MSGVRFRPTRSRHHTPQLALNIAPVECPDDVTIRAGVFPYDASSGHENLSALWNEYRKTHAFARRGDRILCLPRIPGAPEVGDSFEDLPVRENLSPVAVLLRATLIDLLLALQRPVLAHRPIAFLGGPQHNLLTEVLPSDLRAPHWLALRPRYDIDVRLFFFADRKPFLGLALDSRTRRQLSATCKELLAEGIHLDGLYVGQLAEDKDPRLEPHFELLGRVANVRGDQLVLDDAWDDMAEVHAEGAVLEPSSRTYAVVLDQLYGARTEAIREALFKKLSQRRVGPAKLEDLRRVLDYLRKQNFEVTPGVHVVVGELLDNRSKGFPRIDQASKPVYVFDPTGARTSTWADAGLTQHGPYSRQTFPKNRPRICVICQGSAKGRVEQFLHKFFNGQKHPKRSPGPLDHGFVGKYRLEGVATSFFLADHATAPSYQRAALAAISHDDRWDLALVQIEQRFRDLDGDANPYLITKHEFLTHQIPVQEFTLETAALWEGQLAFALNNMALATYAKLGGTPWLLEADRTIAHELVIGIGTAEVGNGRLGDRERVVGFTTVFSGDGNYRVANRSRAVPFTQYEEALVETLKVTVATVASDMNWQAGDHVRLVFHAFKPFKNAEAGAVKTLMKSLDTYDVEYAFLEVSERHPYLLFDQAQEGAYDYETKTQKGKYAPERGRLLKLSEREVLLVLTGPRDVKRPEDGLPSPVLLRLHRESTFTDTTYLARQVYSFANHSWRSFFPGSLPVTVQYSELIAKLLGELSRLPNWNASVLWGRIGHSRWFL